MLASLEDAPLADPNFVYEPKYDGIRAIVEVAAGGEPVRLWSRLGNEKTAQFPEIARALADWGRSRREPVVLDGEIVALNADGEPAGFQNLQGRIHLKEIVAGRRSPSRPSSPSSPSSPSRPSVAFIAFDVLRDGQTDLRNRPLTERRAVLERLLPASAEGFGEARRSALGARKRRKTGSPILRISEQVAADGRALHERALASGWEGLIAKRALSRYVSGKRSSDWRKLKIHQEQEFVIGGWTEPRQSRTYFGALVLGVFDRGRADLRGACRHGIQRARTTTPDASDETDRNRDVAICEPGAD